jgi:hypothetical protein
MRRPAPATAPEITEIIGPADDDLVMQIVDTGATPAEVLEAFTWLTADDQLGSDLARGMRGAVTRVYEILKSAESDPDER